MSQMRASVALRISSALRRRDSNPAGAFRALLAIPTDNIALIDLYKVVFTRTRNVMPGHVGSGMHAW